MSILKNLAASRRRDTTHRARPARLFSVMARGARFGDEAAAWAERYREAEPFRTSSWTASWTPAYCAG